MDLLKQHAYDLSKLIKCPVCEGQTVAASDSFLAQDIRLYIEQNLRAGESREHILQQLTSRYGAHMVVETPLAREHMLLWIIPFVCIGLFFLFKRGR